MKLREYFLYAKKTKNNIMLCHALNVSVALLSMQSQKALGFHQKYFNLCSEDERRSYRFGMISGKSN